MAGTRPDLLLTLRDRLVSVLRLYSISFSCKRGEILATTSKAAQVELISQMPGVVYIGI